jgi:hypothetical protein
VHGSDYYFLSRSAIKALSPQSFFVGPVRDMLQAVDLNQLEDDLRSNHVVIIDVFAGLWPGLQKALQHRFGAGGLKVLSVFMTAVDLNTLLGMTRQAKEKLIYEKVSEILIQRKKNSLEDIDLRAKSAVGEILSALDGTQQYNLTLLSAPEGPDGQDDWTRECAPVGRAKETIDKFLACIRRRLGISDGIWTSKGSRLV